VADLFATLSGATPDHIHKTDYNEITNIDWTVDSLNKLQRALKMLSGLRSRNPDQQIEAEDAAGRVNRIIQRSFSGHPEAVKIINTVVEYR
jgi:hypothetical protein